MNTNIRERIMRFCSENNFRYEIECTENPRSKTYDFWKITIEDKVVIKRINYNIYKLYGKFRVLKFTAFMFREVYERLREELK